MDTTTIVIPNAFSVLDNENMETSPDTGGYLGQAQAVMYEPAQPDTTGTLSAKAMQIFLRITQEYRSVIEQIVLLYNKSIPKE